MPVYLTDVEAIQRATKPRGRRYQLGGGRAVVHKIETDLCGDSILILRWTITELIITTTFLSLTMN